MPYVIWVLLIFPSLFMAVFSRVLCPILPLFANEEGYLPDWLSWFQTPFDSLDGDRHSWERHPGTDAWSTYWRRVCWLWRNAAYGFDMEICGVWVNPDKDTITVDGNPDIGDNTGISGKCVWKAYRDGKLIAWQWYFCHHYEIFGIHKCVRIGFGWKIWNDEKLRTMPAQFWFYINPVK